MKSSMPVTEGCQLHPKGKEDFFFFANEEAETIKADGLHGTR